MCDRWTCVAKTGRRAAAATLIAGLQLSPRIASAHVKWFCQGADVRQPPAPFDVVLTPIFATVCASFLLLMFAGFIVDGTVARRWPRLATGSPRYADTEEKLVRLATGAYFLLLWDRGAVVLWARGDTVLTPELVAHFAGMSALHIIIAAAVAWRRSCLAAAAGIVVLYGYGVGRFGIFHMTDYVFFPGIAAYLALSWLGTPGARAWRTPLLSGGLAFGLMWTAIEKFVYPQWTLDIVAVHPDLAFGFPWRFTVLVAGFVEFTLAFYLMTGRGLVRAGAAAYAMIFLAAVPEFGHLDAVGHIPIVGILAVIGVHGESAIARLLRLRSRGRIAHATAISALYLLSLASFFGLYYAMHRAEYGSCAGGRGCANLTRLDTAVRTRAA